MRIKEDLLAGRYEPAPVRTVDIAKPGGKGTRRLGIPTVVDRLIQQALHQALQPLFEPGFSEFSYGFRPGRSAHHAVGQARAYVGDGRRWVVDLDLEKFFDRVNHDILMSRVARRVCDERVLTLIRRLQAKLRSLFRRGRGRNLGRFIREDLASLLRGWLNYFRLVEVKRVFEALDKWIRRHLRCIQWRQWKRVHRRATALLSLGLDAETAWRTATNGRGPWWNAGASHLHRALPTQHFASLGLVSLAAQQKRFQPTTRTAVYGTVRTVV